MRYPRVEMELPQRASLVPNMVKAKIVHNHGIPVIRSQFMRHVTRNIVVNLCEILSLIFSTIDLSTNSSATLTETKKLDVPSALKNVSGNSLSQVSSPYMTNFPLFLFFICASHVSWFASVEVVSDSAKLSITSRKEGIEPVVMAFTLGMVIVGDVAWAVKGRASPERIRLHGC
jgi:hypothetical protein